MVSDDLFPVVEPCCRRHGAYLIDMVLRGKHAKPVVEIFVDAESGVTADLCTAISREVEARFDSDDFFPESYTLIVSSPGTERPLKFAWQYRKHIGRTLRVKYREGENFKQVTGKLITVSDEGLAVQHGAECFPISLQAIDEAVVVTPW